MKPYALFIQLCMFWQMREARRCGSGVIRYEDPRRNVRLTKVSVPVEVTATTWTISLAFDTPVRHLTVNGFKVERDQETLHKFHLSPLNERHLKPGDLLSFFVTITFDPKMRKAPSVKELQLPGYYCQNPTKDIVFNEPRDTNSLCPLLSCKGGDACGKYFGVYSAWSTAMNFYVILPVTQKINGWMIELKFSKSFTKIECWTATATAAADKKIATLTNKDYNSALRIGSLRLGCQIELSPPASLIGLTFQSKDCLPTEEKTSTTAATTTTSGQTTSLTPVKTSTSTPKKTPTVTPTVTPTTNTGSCPMQSTYNEVLRLSNLFYEAQRSGKLPTDMRIKWRKDSALDDAMDRELNKRIDLEGGYYDAGDYVKFGFPMAAATTMLAWGMVEFEDGYKAAGEYEYGLKTIKWATDYFIKCHTEKFVLYGQVGLGDLDHAFWGRPEDMKMSRPALKITKDKPGSELAGETAAAMAAASIVFKRQGDATYASTLLQHAKELFEFAETYKGNYHNSITDATKFYRSYSGYKDELLLAMSWLYRASEDQTYLNKATSQYTTTSASEFSWDNKFSAIPVLLYGITRDTKFATDSKNFCNKIIDDKSNRTPGGLAWLMKWGANRHAANVAFLCLVAAKHGLETAKYHKFAKEQILFMLGKLGSGGRSYVVGYGTNPPQRPHHASSSCPDAPKVCDWSTFSSSEPNAHILYGALVGGPGKDGSYADVRSDYIKNEVTCDYNAGFQSALAGLADMASKGKC